MLKSSWRSWYVKAVGLPAPRRHRRCRPRLWALEQLEVRIVLAAPDTTIVSPAPFANTGQAHFTLSGTDDVTLPANLTFEYSLDGSAFAATDASLDLLGITDGKHTVRVRAIDEAAEVDASPAIFNWTANTTAPTLSVATPLHTDKNVGLVLQGPLAVVVNDVDVGSATQTVSVSVNNGLLALITTAGLTFTVGDGTNDAAMTFTGTRESVNTAMNGMSYSPSLNFTGAATLHVVTTDNGGKSVNTDVTINVSDPIADTEAPQTSFTIQSPFANTGNAHFEFTAVDNVVTTKQLRYEYSLDGSAFLIVNFKNGPVIDLTDLADGEHTLRVRAIDQKNNTDQTPASSTWTANVTAPTVSLPALQSTPVNTSLLFSSPTGNAIVVNDVDAGSAKQTVKLTVAHGVLSLTTLTGLTFNVGDGTEDATMTFTGTRAAVNTALDGLNYVPAPAYNGHDALQIQVTDNGGLTSSVALGLFVGVPPADAVAPQTSFVVTTTVANTGTGHFEFNGTDAVTPPASLHFEFRVDGGAFAAVNFANGGKLDLTGLGDGEHTLDVRAKDFAGNVDATPASFTWTANVTAPSIVFASILNQNVAAGANLLFNAGNSNLISISDVDAGSAKQTVTITVEHGKLSLATLAGLTIDVGTGTNDTTVTFTGLRAAVNAALNGLKYTAAAAAEFVGIVSLDFEVADNGGLTSSRSLGIKVSA